MAIKTITIDTVEEFFKKHEEANYLVKDLRKFQKQLEEIDFAEPNNEAAFKIQFKSDVSWPQIVCDVVNMKADACWEVLGNKTVTLWWD